MTGRYGRQVVGYPVPDLTAGYVALTQNQSAVFTLPNGPGEFVGCSFWSTPNISTLYYNMWCLLVVDGNTIYDTVWRDVVLMPINYAGHGLFSTSDILASDEACSSLGMLIPYESSFVLTMTNKKAGTMNLVYAIYSRQGA